MNQKPTVSQESIATMETLLSMELNSERKIKGQNVIRVPGGWIYEIISEPDLGRYVGSSVFVPLPPAYNKPSDLLS